MSVGILALAVLVVLPGLWFLLPFGLRHLQTYALRATCRNARAIVLTYDDGPSRSVSVPLLDLLSEEKATATFFVLGRNAGESPDLIARLKADGHEIANHTQNHSNAWKTAPWTSISDTKAGRDTLRGLGVQTDLFRPTYGKTTLASLYYQLRDRVRFAFWTVDTRDSWDRRPIREVLDEIDENGGGVVLMHDFDTPKRGPDKDEHLTYLLNMTRAIIRHARENDLTLCRFSDLTARDTLVEAKT